MLCLIILPIAGAALIIAGTQARNTAVLASALNFLASLIIFGVCKPDEGYQFVSSYPVVPSLGIHFTLGADGLSVAMLLMSTAVTLAAVCVTQNASEKWKLVLCEPALHIRRRNRCLRLARHLFLLHVPRTRPHSDVPSDRHLGVRETARRRHGKLRFISRLAASFSW